MGTTQKTIIIVEDEVDAADMFGEMMRVSGYRVLKSYTSKQAFPLITSECPDVVILDIMMPDVSGFEILRYMRSEAKLMNIPVIIVSAKGLPADIKTGMESGASVYLTKPVGFTELKTAVEKAIQISENTRSSPPRGS
jgi:DNA-binding response OmpR family regulator